jgi:hypothetical protein
MFLRIHKTGSVSPPSLLLTFGLCLLLLGGGVAEAGVQMCRPTIGQAQSASTPAERGTCCCCREAGTDKCSTGLEGTCGQNQKTSRDPLLFNVETLSVGLTPSPVQVAPPSFSKEDASGTVPIRETVYLTNVKLLC